MKGWTRVERGGVCVCVCMCVCVCWYVCTRSNRAAGQSCKWPLHVWPRGILSNAPFSLTEAS